MAWGGPFKALSVFTELTHLSLGMVGGMYVGRGPLGRYRNPVWAGRHIPQGFLLALSRLICIAQMSLMPIPSQHCVLFVLKVVGDRSGCETGLCGAISETTSPSR